MLLEKSQVPRPLTNAFAASLLTAGGIQVTQVRIDRLTDETFYAQVVLATSVGERIVDSRPSDAIALALQTTTEIVAHIVAQWPTEPKLPDGPPS